MLNLSAETAPLEIIKITQKTVRTDIKLCGFYSSKNIATFLEDMIGNDTQESLAVMCLDTKNKLNSYGKVFTGTIRQSTVSPRDIFQRALLSNATRIVIAHNHPSGEVHPSKNDIEFTKRMVEAGDIMDIPLLDSFIVSDTSYFSFREDELIE